MKSIKIAGAALNQTPLDWQGNSQNIITAIQEAKSHDVNVLCLPEICLTGYGCEDLFLSDWLHKKVLQQLLEIKEHTEGITVAVGLPLLFQNKLYNCACVLSDKKILGFTAKSILANDGIHYESRWFTPWQQEKSEQIEIHGNHYPIGTNVYEVDQLKFGIEICEDAWHEKRPLEILSKQNVQLVLNLSASHFSFEKSAKRYDLSVPVSKRYNCAYVYCNLLGNEAGRVVYDGEIIIANQGRLINHNKRFSFKSVNLLTAEISLENKEYTDKKIETKEHFLNENKEEVFADTIALGLFDYMRKSHSKGFVLSLSGGADSSACAILVAYMVRKGLKDLGLDMFLEKLNLSSLAPKLDTSSSSNLERSILKQILFTAYQSTDNSGEETFSAAKSLAESLGATFYSWSVASQVKDYVATLELAVDEKLTWEKDDIALQNIQARTRSPIIWMLTNIKNGLLLTTSNRSEGSVGYATMDGDTSGSIAPIAGINKSYLIEWLRWAEKDLGYEGLEQVNSLKPTAELRPIDANQSDEDDLMPYPILQEIEKYAIGEHLSPVEVFYILKESQANVETNLLKIYISKFFRLWSRNQWKRERLAPSFHVDDYNVDPKSWCRFPILSGGFKEELQLLSTL